MKHGFLTAALLSLCLCTACGSSSEVVFEPTANHTNPPKITTTAEPSAGTETGTTVSYEPEEGPAETELQRRIGVIHALEPQPIPDEGWTDETLLPLISIGGAPASLPFALSDLLFGYEITGEHAEYYTEHADEVFTQWLVFAENQCYAHNIFGELEILPRVETHNPQLPDGADDDELELEVSWCVPAADDSVRYPFSVNCVTIGSSYQDLLERIGLSEQDSLYEPDDSDESEPDWFTVHCSTESVNIVFWGSQNVVRTVYLTERNL